jgi:hypothetical protein
MGSLGLGFGDPGSGVRGPGLGVQGSGFGVWGLGFGVWGSGFGSHWGFGVRGSRQDLGLCFRASLPYHSSLEWPTLKRVREIRQPAAFVVSHSRDEAVVGTRRRIGLYI